MYEKNKSSQYEGYKSIKKDLEEINFRTNEILRKELLTDDAKKIAEEFKETKLTKNLMRKYYHEIKALEARITSDEEYRKNEALIYMLISKVNYDYNRKEVGKKVEALKEFIEVMVRKIKSYQDFKDFVLFFEAVVGFANLS